MLKQRNSATKHIIDSLLSPATRFAGRNSIWIDEGMASLSDDGLILNARKSAFADDKKMAFRKKLADISPATVTKNSLFLALRFQA